VAAIEQYRVWGCQADRPLSGFVTQYVKETRQEYDASATKIKLLLVCLFLRKTVILSVTTAFFQ
jgi:hypothetical protein